MSEEIKERARAEAARILGTRPGCTTCVEAAGIIARLTRERDEAVARVQPWFVWEDEIADEGGQVYDAASANDAMLLYAERNERPEGVGEDWLSAKPITAADVDRMMDASEHLDYIAYRLLGAGQHTGETITAAVVALLTRATAAEARVRELEERIAALEAQLTARGACEFGVDDMCALARRAQEAEARVACRADLVLAKLKGDSR